MRQHFSGLCDSEGLAFSRRNIFHIVGFILEWNSSYIPYSAQQIHVLTAGFKTEPFHVMKVAFNLSTVLQQYHEDGARIEAAFRRYIHRADPKQKEDSYEIIVCHANVIRYFVCRFVLRAGSVVTAKPRLECGLLALLTIVFSNYVASVLVRFFFFFCGLNMCFTCVSVLLTESEKKIPV